MLPISAAGWAETKVSRPSSSILSGKTLTKLVSATLSSGTSLNSPPPPPLQRIGDADVVAGEEGGDVDQQPPARLLGGDVAHPDGRGGEAVAHAFLHVGGGTGRAEARILDLGDHLATDATEDQQP
jgi:hypothetical protein